MECVEVVRKWKKVDNDRERRELKVEVQKDGVFLTAFCLDNAVQTESNGNVRRYASCCISSDPVGDGSLNVLSDA